MAGELIRANPQYSGVLRFPRRGGALHPHFGGQARRNPAALAEIGGAYANFVQRGGYHPLGADRAPASPGRWGATPDSIDLIAADGGQWSRWKPQKGDTLRSGTRAEKRAPGRRHHLPAGREDPPASPQPAQRRAHPPQPGMGKPLPLCCGWGTGSPVRPFLGGLRQRPGLPPYRPGGGGDFAFLSRFARREGFALKILGRRLILYDWRQRMQSAPALALSPGSLLGDPAFDDRSDGLYGGLRPLHLGGGLCHGPAGCCRRPAGGN